MPFKVIAFDADDTLWVNEPYFREAEDQFSALLEDYLPHHSATRELYKRELQNIPLYGYGVKGFMCLHQSGSRLVRDHKSTTFF